jgi:hypothetical protein
VTQPGWSCGRTYSQEESDESDRRRAEQLEAERAREIADRAELESLRRVADPSERLIRAVARYMPIREESREWRGGRRREEPVMADGSAIRTVDLISPNWNRHMTEVGSYDQEALARWFAAEAARAGLPPDRSNMAWPEPRPPRKLLSRTPIPTNAVKTREGAVTDAWLVPKILLKRSDGGLEPDGYIARDGRLFVGWTVTATREPALVPASSITVAGLVYLGYRLGLEVSWQGSLLREYSRPGTDGRRTV